MDFQKVTIMPYNLISELEDTIEALQKDMAQIDLQENAGLSHHRTRASFVPGLIVLNCKPLILRIDTSQTHQRPHLHIDYNKEYHCASYAIDNGELLAGTTCKYHKAIREWIDKNRDLLLKAWECRMFLSKDSEIAVELKGSDFGRK